MTTLLERDASPSVGRSTGSRLQLWARGSLTAVSVMAVGVAALIVLALIAWASDSRSGASALQASRVGMSLWLLVFRTPLHVHGGWVALPPLSLTLGAGIALGRSARTLGGWWAAADVIDLSDELAEPGLQLADAGEVVAAIAVPCGVLATVLAIVAGMPGAEPSTLAAFVTATLVSAIAAAIGLCRVGPPGGRPLDGALAPLPQPVRDGLVGAAVAGLVLIGAATLCLLGSFGWHVATAAKLAGQAGGGLIGVVGLALTCLAVLPNAVLATVGYLAGPGLSVGAGSSITAGGAHLSGTPPLPLLAALPHGPAPLLLRMALWLAIAAAGVAAALLPARGPLPMRDALIRAGVAGGASALGLGLLVSLAGGPAGPGWLATVGASGWQTGLLLLAELLAVAMVTAVVQSSWSVFTTRYD